MNIHDMAIPDTTTANGQEEDSSTDVARPGGRSLRERFNDLPQYARDAILTKHRDFNVEHIDWWDCVYDDFKTKMEDIGIDVDRMYFSGFWSQGDGACFEGSVYNWPKFLESRGYDCPALIKHAEDHFKLSVEHSGHYYHENCTRFSVDLPLPRHDEDTEFAYDYLTYEEGSIQEATVMALLNQYVASALEAEFIDAFRDHMRDLYKQLEDEHDHLTSDEAVLDSLEANDLLEDEINDHLENEDA
jgi:hypothetical protein